MAGNHHVDGIVTLKDLLNFLSLQLDLEADSEETEKLVGAAMQK